MAFRPHRASAGCLRHALRAYLAQQSMDPTVVAQVVLAADEAFVNALTHAGGVGSIRVAVCVADGEASVEVRDHGNGFSLERTQPGSFPDMRRLHGRGMFLIERMMDSVSVRSGPDGTTVRMVRRLA